MKALTRKLKTIEAKYLESRDIQILVDDLWSDFSPEDIFVNKEEQEAYVSWRCNQIADDYVLGLTDICIYSFNQDDITKHLEEFRTLWKEQLLSRNISP